MSNPGTTRTDMVALRAHRRGGPEVLVWERAPRPHPEAGEVLVAVCAAGITFDELGWEETWTRDGVDRTPIIPAHEISGVVVATGAGTEAWSAGDEVYGLLPFDRDGAAAEFVVAPSEVLASKPASLPHPVAAAVPLSALTAWQSVVGRMRVQAGDEVLVQGAAGAVGLFAVQLAALAGARVTATCRGRDAELLTRLGATTVVDFEHEDLTGSARFTAVLDTVGGAVLRQSVPVLAAGGRLVTLSAPPPPDLGLPSDSFFVVTPDRDQLEEITALLDAAVLTAVVAASYPLEQGAEAYASGRTSPRPPGKTVLVVREPERLG
jgi:NADPH:quinone reductase-like Zn-dependent oxidoreductase